MCNAFIGIQLSRLSDKYRIEYLDISEIYLRYQRARAEGWMSSFNMFKIHKCVKVSSVDCKGFATYQFISKIN